MDRNTFIDKIKTMFSEVEKEVVESESEFVDVTTEDGIELIVRGEEVVEGVEVYVIGEDGSEVPVSAGEWVIDGKVIVTDIEGKISEIKEVEAEETPEAEIEEPVVEAELSEEVVVDEEKLALEARLSALESSLSNIAESMSAIDGLSKAVAEIAGLPADKEIKLSKVDNAGVNKSTNSREEKLKAFSTRNK